MSLTEAASPVVTVLEDTATSAATANAAQNRKKVQSLGGSKPGDVIEIVLPNPGPLGVRVEKRKNGDIAFVNKIVSGSQAEAAGFQRGDVICFACSQGQNEISYDTFLQIAKSPRRPICEWGSVF